MRFSYIFAIAVSSASFSSHAFTGQSPCTAEELNAESSALVTKTGDFALLSKALAKANRKRYAGGSYEVAVQHDRTGQIVSAVLVRTTGYDFLDEAISNYMQSYEVSPGSCGKAVLPISLTIPK